MASKLKKIGKRWVFDLLCFTTGSFNSLYHTGPPYRGKQIQMRLKEDPYPICYLLVNKFLEFSQTLTDEVINTFVLQDGDT